MMRKLIITIVLTAFIVTLSSPILNAAQWDAATGPKWPERAYNEIPAYSGDDSGWNDADESGGETSDSIDISDYFLIKLFIFWIIPDQIGFEEDITAGSYAESSGGDINSSRNTAGQ
ncbi:MAG: hypothetical protein ABIJ12_09210 [bacterium]